MLLFSLFLMQGSNQKCPIESDRGVNGVTQFAIRNIGGISSLAGPGAKPQLQLLWDGVSLKTPRPRGWVRAGRPSGGESSFNKRNMYQYPHVSQLFILTSLAKPGIPGAIKIGWVCTADYRMLLGTAVLPVLAWKNGREIDDDDDDDAHGFRKIFDRSSFSSTFYHVRKTAQDFEQVHDML